MFKANSAPGVPELNVTQCSGAVLESVVKFAYTDRVPFDEVSIDLMKAARFFEMYGLINFCEVHLSKTLNEGNAIEMYLAAHECNAQQLIDVAGRVIIDDGVLGLVDTPELLALLKDHPKEGAHLLKLSRDQIDGLKKALQTK